MPRNVLRRQVRPVAPASGERWATDVSQRRWGRVASLAVLAIVGALSWGGYTLGKVAAAPVGRAQAAAVDRAAPSVPLPPLPAPPHYPLSTPRPLPRTGPVTGLRFGAGEATPLAEPGLPITVLVPRDASFKCRVFSFPGVGTASTAEWECADGSDETGQETGLRVLLAPCPPPCGANARSGLRPEFVDGPVRAVDGTTWLADFLTREDSMGRRTLHLMMEHVWTAPAGVLGTGSPAQTLYVAARVTNVPDDRSTAEKIMNGLRAQL